MRVLLVNTFHYNRGGDSTYTFNLAKLLGMDRKNKVVHFAMKHPMNYTSEFSDFFVPEIDLPSELSNGSFFSWIKVLKRTIYSNTARRNLGILLDNYPVDIAHIQNIHRHITPSIFHTLKSRDIPLVWTLHDYFLLCPNSLFFVDYKICESCRGKSFYNVVLKRCRKNSFSASLIVMLEEYIHRLLGLIKLVDYFIAPSKFLRDKFIEYSFPPEKIIHIPNFIETTNIRVSSQKGAYILYSGRLCYEKGVTTLMGALSSCNSANLLVAGDGPLKRSLEEEAQEKVPGRIEFLGHLDRGELYRIIGGSRFVVIPSLWYENSPYAVFEAYAHGKPVIASRIGGLQELVRDNETGFLFEPGNEGDLACKIQWMLDNPSEAIEMGRIARDVVEKEYNPMIHKIRIANVYRKAMESRNI